MATLTNTKIKDTYDGLLKTTDNEALDASGVTLIEDGLGNASALSVGRSGNGVTITGSLNATLATAAQPNITSVGTLSSLAVSGNLTVDTNTLFVNSSNNRVGVGTTSPDNITSSGTILSISTSGGLTTNDIAGSLTFITNDVSYTGTYADGVTAEISSISESATGAAYGLAFSTGTTTASNRAERMRIDASGNVGIGESNPQAKLHITGRSDTSDITVRIEDTDGSVASGQDHSNIEYYTTDGAAVSAEVKTIYADALGGLDYTISTRAGGGSLTERLRIDASGSVNIGTTSSDPITTASRGFSFNGSDKILRGYQASLPLMSLSRGNDGQAIIFNRGTTAVGSIDVATSGVSIYLGGTAAANALDDYEEGTWTPTISFGGSSVGVTYSFNNGTYTKIGRQVTVNGLLQLSNKGTSTGNVSILGLPFTIRGLSEYYSAPSLRLDGVSFANAFMGLGVVGQSYFNIEEITEAGVISRLTNAEFTNNSSIVVSMTYFVL